MGKPRLDGPRREEQARAADPPSLPSASGGPSSPSSAADEGGCCSCSPARPAACGEFRFSVTRLVRLGRTTRQALPAPVDNLICHLPRTQMRRRRKTAQLRARRGARPVALRPAVIARASLVSGARRGPLGRTDAGLGRCGRGADSGLLGRQMRWVDGAVGPARGCP